MKKCKDHQDQGSIELGETDVVAGCWACEPVTTTTDINVACSGCGWTLSRTPLVTRDTIRCGNPNCKYTGIEFMRPVVRLAQAHFSKEGNQ